MEYRWIEDIDEFRSVSKEWDYALLSSKSDNPFLLSDFILSWWGPYSRGLRLKIFVLTEGGVIIGGLPLCQNRFGYLEHPGRIAANYTEPFCLADDEIFWGYFFDALGKSKGWKGVRISRLRADRFDPGMIRTVSVKNSRLLYDADDTGCSYLVNIPKDFSGYLGHMPKKLRYYIKRSEQGLSRLGRLELRSFTEGNKAIALADKFIEFSRKSFKNRNRKSAFENGSYRSFFRDLVKRFCGKGYLDANALMLDNKVIAIHFGYLFGNNLNYVFPAFDVDLAGLNPGHLLIYKLIELGSKRGNKFLDMYTGYQFYKEQWSDYKKKIINIEVRLNNLFPRVERSIRRVFRAALMSPAAAGLVQKLKR